jgi:hypothetical protein
MNAIIVTERPIAAPPSTEPSTSPQAPRSFIKRHPVLTFYALAFAISRAAILLVIGGPGNFPGTREQIDKLFLLVMPAWARTCATW